MAFDRPIDGIATANASAALEAAFGCGTSTDVHPPPPPRFLPFRLLRSSVMSALRPASLLLAAALTLLAVGLLLATSPVAAQASDNANLSSLSILGTGVTGFSAGTTSYTVNLDAPERPATVAAAAADTNASVVYSPADADSDTSGHQLVLNEGRNGGRNTVSVTVTAEDGATTKTYTVTVNVSDAAEGVGTTALATVDPGGRNNPTIQYWGSIRSAGDVDWIRVRLEAGQMYRFALKGSYQNDSRTLDLPIITGVYDADGDKIAGTSDLATVCDPGGSDKCNARVHYLPPDGTGGDHYVNVQGYGSQSGTYALRVQARGDDTQPDNVSTPGEIAAGASVEGIINYRGDVDWFRTTLEAGAQYVATVQPRGSGPAVLRTPVVKVYDANGKMVTVSYSDFWAQRAFFVPVEAGTYYLAVESRFIHTDQTGSYTLGLEFRDFRISGATVVGETLTADTSDITDPGGIANASYTYQWIRVDGDTDTDITGATGRTYTLTDDDAGLSIKVKTNFTDDAGNDETRISRSVGPVRPAVRVFWNSSSYTAVEGAGGVVVTVKLNADPGASVTVPIEVRRQGGAATGDYSGVPDSVTIDENSDTDDSDRPYETFTVTATQDSDLNDESISLSFGTLPTGVTAGSTDTTTVQLKELVREAPDHWLLVPEGLGGGGEFRLLFATSGRRDASSSDIAVYNTFVQNAASGGHALVQDYSDHFAALGSTEAVEARVNTVTTHTSTDQGVPIYWLNGPKAADQYQDFYDGSWDNRDPGRDEDGSEVDFDGNNADDRIWTGSKENGAEGFSSGNSRALGRSTVRHGSPGQGSGNEISFQAVSSSNNYRLYGLSYVFRVADTDTPYVVRGGVEVTSTPEAGTDTYGAGEDIEITVTFNEAVVVAGTPQFWLSVGGGKLADLVAGSGTTKLVFAYTVQSGDADDNGIWIPGHDNSTNRSFRLDSGDAVTGVATPRADAILQNLPLGTLSGHKVDGSLTGADARLSALSLSGITVVPAFAAETTAYSATVDNSVSATTVTATPSQSSAGVVTTPTDADTVASGHQVDLAVGDNTITVTVTGTNTTSTRTYTVTVTRLSALSADADLSGLTIEGTGVTGFAAATTAYTHNVANSVRQATVAATASDGNAVVSYSPADANTGTTGHQVDLNVGNTTVTVTVTAEDGTTKIYSIAIYRAAAFQVTAQFGAATYTAAEGGAAATVTVNLSADPGETVTIPITASGSGGAVSGDYSLSAASVTINSGQTSATFTVTASDASDDDGESVTLGFGTLPPGVSAGTQASATVSLTDNDDPRVTAQFGAASYTAAEDGATATVTVNLSADPERSVTIPITAAGAGGAGSGDYSLSAASVTINSGQTSATFTVTASDDSDDDDGESVTLGFGTLPPGVSAGTQASATVSLTDNDDPRVTAQFGAASYTAAEDGATATVTVNLSADPERSVTIPITAAGAGGAGSGDYSLSASSVTINSGQTSASFTVTATNENDIDDGESVTLGFGVFPDRVSAGAQASATVELVNDDVVAVKVKFVEERYVAVEGTHGPSWRWH